MIKRYRVKRHIKPGELRLYWGIDQPGNAPDLLVHNEAPAKRGDAGMLIHAFERVFDSSFPEGLRKELENRDYDLTTLKFSIMKKEVTSSEWSGAICAICYKAITGACDDWKHIDDNTDHTVVVRELHR